MDHTLWLATPAGEIRAALPLLVRRRLGFTRAASMPYGTPGGPWLRDPADTEAAFLLLREFAARHARPWSDCVLVDHGPDSHTDIVRRAWPMARPRAAGTHRLTLPSDVDTLERAFARRTRKAMRRGVELGLELESPADPAPALEEFAAFQRREADLRGSRFVYPPALLARGAREGWLRVHRARRAGRTLAVTVIAEGRGRWFAWLVAHAGAAREAPVGEFLFGRLLADAVQRGFHEADFGSSGGRAGTEFFKAGFGADPRPYRVWRSGPWSRGGR